MTTLANAAETTLQADISSGATTLTVPSGKGAMFPASDFPLTLDDGTNQEIVHCTSRSSDSFTITRAYESYAGAQTAHAFAAATPTKIAQTGTAGTISVVGHTHTSSLNTASDNLSTDTTLGTSWTDLISLSLGAGTWMAWATCSTFMNGGNDRIGIRIWDGSTNYGGADNTQLSGFDGLVSCVSEPIVLGTTTTVKLQGQSNAGAVIAKKDGRWSTGKVTHLRAIQVA